MGGRGAIGRTNSNNTNAKLPELIGTEKQIKWATDIRNNFIEMQKNEAKITQQKEFVDALNHEKERDSNIYNKYKKYEEYIEKKKKNTKASHWIETRDKYDVNRAKGNLERYMKDAKGRRKIISFIQYASWEYDI